MAHRRVVSLLASSSLMKIVNYNYPYLLLLLLLGAFGCRHSATQPDSDVPIGINGPKISEFRPLQGFPGSLVLIVGDRFDTTPGVLTVKIGIVPLTVERILRDSVWVSLPDSGITSGVISVIQNGDRAMSALPFTVLFPFQYSKCVFSYKNLIGVNDTDSTVVNINGRIPEVIPNNPDTVCVLKNSTLDDTLRFVESWSNNGNSSSTIRVVLDSSRTKVLWMDASEAYTWWLQTGQSTWIGASGTDSIVCRDIPLLPTKDGTLQGSISGESALPHILAGAWRYDTKTVSPFDFSHVRANSSTKILIQFLK